MSNINTDYDNNPNSSNLDAKGINSAARSKSNIILDEVMAKKGGEKSEGKSAGLNSEDGKKSENDGYNNEVNDEGQGKTDGGNSQFPDDVNMTKAAGDRKLKENIKKIDKLKRKKINQ